MSELIIEVSNISKQYAIGSGSVSSLGRLLRIAASLPYNKLRGIPSPPLFKKKETFWPLKNISFNVQRGEIVGIIGANGAGKSTLLKILSRIIHPTGGEAKIYGRVSSLLEVGTGFNANMSGRENIFMNASLHGLSRKEITAKFDEIVDFSGVEKFIDTPVKHYSSGMYSRLAFSVAAHLDPDVLFVDEVLSVGDLAFQQKCLNKFSEMVGGARTVLFVSHNLSAISSICSKVLWLDRGEVRFFGQTEAGIATYYQSMLPAQSDSLSSRFDRTGTGDLKFTKIAFYDNDLSPCEQISCGQELVIGLEYEAQKNLVGAVKEINIAAVFKNDKGQRLFGTPSEVLSANINNIQETGQFLIRIKKLPLLPGVYDLDLGCVINRLTTDKIVSAKKFFVVESDFYNSGRLPAQQMGDFLVDYDISLSK